MNSASTAPQPSLLARIFSFRVVVPLFVLPAMVAFLCACNKSTDTALRLPTHENVTTTTALLGGTVSNEGNDSSGDTVPVTERGVVFSTTSDNNSPEIGGTGVTQMPASTNGAGVFTVQVSGLLPGTEYSFRAYAIGSTTAHSSVAAFTTQAGSATVIDPISDEIRLVSARLGGNVRSDGGFAITARGIVYAPTAENSDPLIGDSGVVNLPDTVLTMGVFTLPAKNLSPLTDYTFKAYATTSEATSYSPTADFSTTNIPADTGKIPAFEGGDYEPMHVSAMAIQPDGKTLIGGSFAAVGNTSHSCLVRLNADGSVDHSFAPQVTGEFGEWVTSIVVQPDGKIVIGGNLSNVDGEPHANIARLNADGSVDSSFTAAANYGFVSCLALQADGKILLGGDFLGLNPAGNDFGADYWWLGRLNADGSVDMGFNIGVEANDPNNPVKSIAVLADGKIMVAGWFTTYNGVERNGLVRLKTDGTLDPSFVPTFAAPNDESYCVVEQADGKILVGGHSNVDGPGSDRTRLERLNADGSLDSSFTFGIDDVGRITSVVLQADGKMLVCSGPSSGDITLFPGHFSRLNADGSLDGTFDPGTGPNKYVEGIAIQGNGKIMACGTFTMVNGEPATGFAQFDNGEAIQELVSPDPTLVKWRRSGSATLIRQVTFDLSTDSGVTWTPLGAGTRNSGGWELSGQSLPASGMLRARGRTSGGRNNGSEGILEQVAAFPSVPLLANITSSGITEASAILGSNLTFSGGLRITERGVIYARTEDNASPVIDGAGVTTAIGGVTSTRVFTQLVTGLTPGTHYTFRAYAKSSAGTGYSGIQNFSTLGVPTVIEPTMGNQIPLGDFRVEITLGGNITSDNGLPISERGVVYSKYTSNPELGQSSLTDVAVAPGTSLGAFTTTISNLRGRYWFRAYAKTAAGVAYSPTGTFTTPELPTVNTTGATVDVFSPGTFSLRGVYFNDFREVTTVTEAGIEYGKVPDGGRLQTDSELSYTTVSVAGTKFAKEFFAEVSGLEPGRYGFRAYAQNSYGRREGRVIFFTVASTARESSGAAAPKEDASARAFSAPPEDGYDPDISPGFVQALAVQPDGKTIVAGEFETVGGVEHLTLARLNTDGSVDATFTPRTDGIIYSVVVQGDGKILIGGVFNTVNNETRNGIARLNADGTLESSATFDPGTGADNIVYSIVLQPDGKILLGGLFDRIQSVARNGIARLNADGGVDGTFDPGTGADDAVYSVALQTDGKILIGGAFQNVAATARNRIARLDVDGGLDATFAPASGADDKVDCVILQPDGKILIGGYFTTVNGTNRNRIARLTTTGALDGSFDPGTGADGVVYTMSLQTDGKVMLGGDFQNVNDTARSRIARLDANGGLDTTFDPGTGADAEVDGIALQADGNILFGGGFTLFDGVARNRIARIGNDAVTQSVTVTNANQAQWMRSGAGPEVSTVAFQVSTDSGVTWTAAGDATRIAGGWQGTGLSLPPNGTLRAIGRTSGGFLAASSGLVAETAVFALAPGDIQLEQPVATSLSNGATRDFGGILLSEISQRTFTVTNTGSGHLAGVQISIAGTHASQFAIDTLPAEVLAPAGSGTFQISFTPTSLGTKNAQLQITSNDPDESPFEITLTGAGATPQGIWRQTHFSSVSNSDIGADLYDFDGDGLANVLEYAFALNPTLAASKQIPTPQVGGGNIFFDFTQPAGVSGVIYGAEWSTSLKPGEWTNIPDTGTPPQHLFTVPTTGDNAKFLRLKVTNE
jgi:uncharacterized delta-60 repeat protein